MEDRTNEQFVDVDFTGSRFRGVIFSGVTISDAWLADVDISGMVAGVSINGIDVTGYVDAELDRRHPERRLLAPDDPPGARLAWQTVEELSSATVERARAFPPAALATDRWISGPVLGDPDPFHRLGRPNDPLDEIPAGMLDLDARPALDEVLAVRRDRMDRVRAFVHGVDAKGLEREVRSPNGGATTVLRCLHVVLREEWWHDQYANRDLAILEGRPPSAG